MSRDMWYCDEKADVSPIVSSRVRLARNLRKYPFQAVISDEASREMVGEAVGLLSRRFEPVDFDRKSESEKRALLERHCVSPEFLRAAKPKGLMMRRDERVSVMLNEEDHVRIQAIAPGEDIESAWADANQVDDFIEENMEYAFDRDYGYLTSCPTNTGTGMRASFMAHLPMMEKTGHLRNVLPSITKFGYTIRGIYGEGTEPLGSVYQVSNQVTLGKSEEDILKGLRNVAGQMVDIENRLRERAMADASGDFEDQIYRAFGILAYSRKIGADEAMSLLSNVRLGYLVGIRPKAEINGTIYQIMMDIQPGNLQWREGKELDENARDAARARFLRGVFGGTEAGKGE
ncbi:MAG: protein arginine kinase [Firmicutes bacterium]|nr:protein arginine kinase [Bacillota bacterium]